MTSTLNDDDQPRRSDVVRRELEQFRRDLSDAAEHHRRDDYRDALANLKAAEAELASAELREHHDTTRAAKAKAAEATFRESYGHATAGEVLADRFRNAVGVAKVTQADLTAAVARVVLEPKPTAADLGAEVLRKALTNAEETRKAFENPAA